MLNTNSEVASPDQDEEKQNQLEEELQSQNEVTQKTSYPESGASRLIKASMEDLVIGLSDRLSRAFEDLSKVIKSLPAEIVRILKTQEVIEIHASKIPSSWFYEVYHVSSLNFTPKLPDADEGDFSQFAETHTPHLFEVVQSCIGGESGEGFLQSVMTKFWNEIDFGNKVEINVKERLLKNKIQFEEGGEAKDYSVTGIPYGTFLYCGVPILTMELKNQTLKFDKSHPDFRSACSQLSFYVTTETDFLVKLRFQTSHYYGILSNGLKWCLLEYNVTNRTIAAYSIELDSEEFSTYNQETVLEYDNFKKILYALYIAVRNAKLLIKSIDTPSVNEFKKRDRDCDDDHDAVGDNSDDPNDYNVSTVKRHKSESNRTTSIFKQSSGTHRSKSVFHEGHQDTLLPLTARNLDYIHRSQLPTLYDKVIFDLSKKLERDIQKPVEISVEEFSDLVVKENLVQFV